MDIGTLVLLWGGMDIGTLVMLWVGGGYRNLSHAVSVGGMDIGNLVMQWGWLAAETLVLFWSGILQSAAGNIEKKYSC